MAVRWLESFRHVRSLKTMAERYGVVNNIENVWESIQGRFTGNHFGLLVKDSFKFTTPVLSLGDTCTVGIAVASRVPFNTPIITFLRQGQEQLKILLSGTETGPGAGQGQNQFFVFRGGTNLGTTAAFPGDHDLYHFLEVRVKCHPSDGFVFVHVDEASSLSIPGPINTALTNNAGIDQIMIDVGQNSTAALPKKICDFYIFDSTGGIHDGFFGECAIQGSYASADGDAGLQQFTLKPGLSGPHWVAVNDAGPDGSDGDTTYVYSQAEGNIELYDFQDVINAGDTAGPIMMSVVAKLNSTGSRTLQLVARQAGVNGLGNLVTVSGTSYKQYYIPQDRNPNGNVAWDNDSLDAGQLGVRSGA